jgi:hypothetical protein
MDEKTKGRAAKLFDLGLTFDGSTFLYYDINFHWTDITCMSDSEFDKALEGATKRKAAIDFRNSMELRTINPTSLNL